MPPEAPSGRRSEERIPDAASDGATDPAVADTSHAYDSGRDPSLRVSQEPAPPVGRGSAEPLRPEELVGSTESRPTKLTVTGQAHQAHRAQPAPQHAHAKPGTAPVADASPADTTSYWDGSDAEARHPKDPAPDGAHGQQELDLDRGADLSSAAGLEATPNLDQTSSKPSPDISQDSTASPAPEPGSPAQEDAYPYPAYPAGVTEGSGGGSQDLAGSDAAVARVEPPPVAPAVARRRPRPPPKEEAEEEEEEEGGGPVKPFLDHLEDLRWTLIKVISSVALGMLVCLVASDKLVAFLMWPLKHAQRMLPAAHQKVPLLLGTNQLSKVTAASLGLASTSSNRITAVALRPLQFGTNYVLTLQVQTNAATGPDEPDMVVLKNYGPISAFMVALKLALYGGLVLSAPFVIFFTGQFVLPALKVKEKAFLYRVAGFGSLLFIGGILFCYFLIVQVALMASVQFSQWMGFGADEWRAEDYVSFVSKFMLGMGLSFQLPLVILTLVKIGLVDYTTLASYRAYFIVGNLVVSAVVTPSGDPLTMVLMALPLQVLYEGSLVVARYWARKEREREAAEA